tara:strand:- start:21 stop:398 length:378 start_codon:yes stop_codon:yes gene_type:complete
MAVTNLAKKIELYCASKSVSTVDFRVDVMLEDDGDGNGAYIKTWNLDIDKPTDDVLNKFDAVASIRMNILRSQRDKLLAETDWMGNQDYSITDAWKTYRQALRDITDQTPSDNALSNITWPTKPS